MSGVKGRTGGSRNGAGSKQSGINIWLQDAIRERLGSEQAEQIISEAKKYDDKRYIYMIGVLDTLGHKDIGEEYRAKKNADQRERFVRDKKRHLARYKQRLEECKDPQRSVWLRGKIQTIEDYLKRQEDGQIVE